MQHIFIWISWLHSKKAKIYYLLLAYARICVSFLWLFFFHGRNHRSRVGELLVHCVWSLTKTSYRCYYCGRKDSHECWNLILFLLKNFVHNFRWHRGMVMEPLWNKLHLEETQDLGVHPQQGYCLCFPVWQPALWHLSRWCLLHGFRLCVWPSDPGVPRHLRRLQAHQRHGCNQYHWQYRPQGPC